MDSIDPIKLVGEYENLRDFELKCTNDIIEIKINNIEWQCEYIKRITGLKWWLNPHIKVDNNTITILLK